MDMPKKVKKSATAATTSAVLSAVSLLGVSLGVSVVAADSGPAFAASHLKEATITHRKAGKLQHEFLQSNQHKQSNPQKLPSAGHTKR
jgi:hypothetical protein